MTADQFKLGLLDKLMGQVNVMDSCAAHQSSWIAADALTL
jgi:hypothetical protein